MKIKKLRIAGFGPYKNEQLIDFERFDADGIFLITGKTGAGKSSILDAICFALYASVPRYDGTESQLRSDHCAEDDPTFVELEFVLGETDYRIYRTPRYERAKKRGGGTTTSQPDARLDIRDESVEGIDGLAGWRGIAARPVDVGNELSRILPLKQDQFLQVILLAQNRFQKFLLAKTDDRRAILRTLFGTSRFERLESELIARRKQLGDELAAAQLQIDGYAATIALQGEHDETPSGVGIDWFADALSALEQRGSAAAEVATAADALLAAANTTLLAQSEVRRNQDRRDAASATLEQLELRSDEIDQARLLLVDARRAAQVWPQILASTEARTARTRAELAETRAERHWLELNAGTGSTDADEVSQRIDELLGRLGALDDILLDEKQLPGLALELGAAEVWHTEAAEAVEAARVRLAEIPEQLQSVETQFASARLRAARGDEARATLARLEAESNAATELLRIEPELTAALLAEKAASAANRDAALRYDQILDQRLAGHAAELASALVAGDPCAVCGSPEHPAPANSDAPPLTDVHVEAARDELGSRQAELERAHAAWQNLSLRQADARARAHDKTAEQLAAEIDEATALLKDVTAAVQEQDAFDRQRTALRSEQAEADARLESLRGEADVAQGAVTSLHSKQLAISERLAAHRGEYATVTERAERLQVELASARALHDAQRESRQAQLADETALAALTTGLAQEGFETQDAALAARMSEGDVAQQEAEIRRYDDEITGVRAVLAGPELRELPEQAIDLTEAAEAADAAGAARDEAFAASSTLGERISTVAVLVAAAQEKLAASATLLTTQKQVRELAAVVHGEEPNTKRMRLETYVLAAQLEEIIAAANLRLRTMTGARYALEHDDSVQFRGAQSGLGLAIRDEHTGRARPTHSLSGGETFLASLALALGLAETVSNQAGGIALDTLFVDEGFGSLDSETLETAMSTLDSLRAGGRTIGLISHVESMKEQIPAKLAIVVSNRGDSNILA